MDPIEILQNELIVRKKRNPAYSLRAFAKQLQIPPGRLSELLSRKRKLAPKLANKIADQCFDKFEHRKKFLTAAGLPLQKSKQENPELTHFKMLPEDEFALIASPIHITLLTLLETNRENLNISRISKLLEISTVETRNILVRLERLGLVTKQDNFYLRNSKPIKTTTDIPSIALKKSHKETLEQTIKAIDEVPVELRDITSICIPSDPSHLSEVKDLIKDFRRKIYAILESGHKTQVYNLNIQLVPLIKKEKLGE